MLLVAEVGAMYWVWAHKVPVRSGPKTQPLLSDNNGSADLKLPPVKGHHLFDSRTIAALSIAAIAGATEQLGPFIEGFLLRRLHHLRPLEVRALR
jgi:hypothetical protein